jgi:3-deoxy-D-manno-octulosonate 8-phosphate phosphatase KdsC-like HAD superfamily phosphatase
VVPLARLVLHAKGGQGAVREMADSFSHAPYYN